MVDLGRLIADGSLLYRRDSLEDGRLMVAVVVVAAVVVVVVVVVAAVVVGLNGSLQLPVL